MRAGDGGPPWQVRAPVAADEARWRELYGGYAHFYGVEQSAEQADIVWSWLQDPHHELGCLLVEDERGRVVGLAHHRPFARPLAASTGCHLDDLFIEPAARGRGAVDALLGELRAMARTHGWSVVRWITAEDNHRGQAVYDRYADRTTWVTYDMAPEPPGSG